MGNHLLLLLTRHIQPYRLLMWLSIFFLLASVGGLLMLPSIFGQVANQGFSDLESFSVSTLDILIRFSVVSVIVSVTGALRYYCVTWLGENMMADLKKSLYNHILGIEFSQFEKLKIGELLSRMSQDVVLIEQILTTSISMLLRSGLQALGAVVLMWFTSRSLTLAFLISIPMAVLSLMVLVRRMRQLARLGQDKQALVNAYAQESLQAIATLRAFGHEDYDKKAFGALLSEGLAASKKRIKLRSMMIVCLMLLILFSFLGLYVYGSIIESQSAEITGQGFMLSFFLYAFIVAFSLVGIGEAWGEVIRAMSAADRVFEIYDLKSMTKGQLAIEKNKINGEIIFENISFAYPQDITKTVLSAFDLHIKAKETVAFVGPSGAGKSTVIALLLRFYRQNHGRIYLDGIDIDQINHESYTQAISWVSQDIVIFSGSIFENIAYSNPKASKEQVHRCAKEALVEEFVEKLTEGYDTQVGERGMRLSGGQKQRLGIARAFLHKAPILILDEATSNLDVANEKKLQATLTQLSENKTTLIIAHRLSTIKNADRIVFIEDGSILAQGDHDTLMKTCEPYSNFVKLQWKKEKK